MTGERTGGREPPPVAAALVYAHRHWAVFPCHAPAPAGCTCGGPECGSPGKHPRTRRGLHDATTHPEVIKRWWQRWPSANVGIRTGTASRLVVLDIDPPHGGTDSLYSLVVDHGALPATMTVRTGSGGHHLYFAHPGGVVHNSTSTLGPGLDVRGDGGYVIAPPSIHAAGERYRWGRPARLAALPDWLCNLVQPPEPKFVPPPSQIADLSGTRATAWARAALAGEVSNVHAASEGQRNHTLNRAAFALGQLVAGGYLDEDDVMTRLEAAGVGAGLGAHETHRTIDSGLRAGRQHPRHPANRGSHGTAVRDQSTEIDLRSIELPHADPPGVKAAEPAEAPNIDAPALP